MQFSWERVQWIRIRNGDYFLELRDERGEDHVLEVGVAAVVEGPVDEGAVPSGGTPIGGGSAGAASLPGGQRETKS